MDIEKICQICFDRKMLLGMSGKDTQVKEELVSLMHYLKQFDIKNFLEIGTLRGGTFYALGSLCSNKKISLDLIKISKNECLEMRNWLKSQLLNVFFIEGSSHDEKSLDHVRNILNGELIDLLYLDGDTSYKGIKQDYEMYFPFVNMGGIIVIHDINPQSPVSKFWNELKGDIEFNNYTTENKFYGTGVIIKK